MKKKYPIARHVLGRLVKSFIRSITGLENLPKDGPFIVASNSGSSLDSLFIAYILVIFRNKMFHAVSKRTAFFNFFGDSICKKWAHCLLMDSDNKAAILDTADDVLKEGGIVMIYPEGTRTRDGELNKAKNGVARLALKSKVPVIPFAVRGSFEVFPRGSLFPRKLGRSVDIYIGKPMTFKEYYGRDWSREMLEEITTRVMKNIAGMLGREYSGKTSPKSS